MICGVAHIHSCGIVHRDLKPANVLLSGDDTCRVADFGLSCLLNKSAANPLETLLQTQCGTPAYMEERITRGAPYDAKADVWSLMLIVFEMAVGNRASTSASNDFSLENLVSDGRLRACLTFGLQYAHQQRPAAGELAQRFAVVSRSPP